MNRLLIHTLLIFLCSVTITYGQISPGELSEAHKELEGISNCTQCHEIGNKVLNSKCLQCHDEVQTLIDQDRGFHASSEVEKQDCFACHSEHHGRKFEMIRFDEDNFDHDEAGYTLEGEHKIIDCRECHKPDYIQDSEISMRQNTFLGLEQECLSCHDDYHQETLSNECVQCHDFEAFSPASNFDHDEAEFTLNGKHIDVDCVQCHKESTRKGKEFQEFTGLAFNDCVSCHDDPHNNQIPGDCVQCHSETSFTVFNGKENFNHNSTDFTLKGKHKSVDCFSCHKETDKPLFVFQDNLQVNENNCVKCHDDQHEGKFGLDCAKCHRETSFISIKKIDNFDHSVTDYALQGKHLQVDCKQCHTGSYTETIDFSACNKCHDDYHNGEFIQNNVSPDCIECHSLNEDFEYSLYTLEQHQQTTFPLEGAHVATPCYACHISEDDERWTFRELGSDCIDCHTDIHEGYISDPFYPNNDCKVCHVNDSWSEIETFDHTTTNWPLDGAHLKTDCRACHFTESTINEVVSEQKFTNLETSCVSCHENNHDDSFAIDGVTDCVRCHVTSSWMPENFNHDTTNFPLQGKHKEVDCRACHISSLENGETVILYKLNKLECIDCHQ